MMRITFAVAGILVSAIGLAQEPVADVAAPKPEAATDRQAKLDFFRERMRDLELRDIGGGQVGEFPRLDAWPADGVYYHCPLPLADYPFRRET